jgi:hypothetical protein
MPTASAKSEERNFQKAADRHGRSAVESMRDDLAALAHARECLGTLPNGKPCKRGSETRTVKLSNGRTIQQMKHNNPEAWHDEEAARDAITNGHYGTEVRDGWHTPGDRSGTEAEEYRVTLGGGGPAMRITGELQNGEPTTAQYEFQDWFKPWTPAKLSSKDEATLLEWVSQLYWEGA